MDLQELAPGVYRIPGSVWGGVLVADGYALLLDAPETPPEASLLDALKEAGVHTVEGVLLTQHRRAHSGGLLQWAGPLPPVRATEEEAALLRRAGETWASPRGKYHRYEAVPDRFLPLQSIPAAGDVRDGEEIHWRGMTITPVVFSARSLGDCAYVVEAGGRRVAFCGALAMAGGHIHDLYSFQKALPEMMGYHGFLGGLPAWIAGMARLRALEPDCLSPAYGPAEADPEGCLALLERRLRDYAAAYADISAVRYYFPEEFHRGFEAPLGLTPPEMRAPLAEHPSWLSRIGETTSYLLRADSGRAILIDTGDLEAVQTVQAMLENGRITALDACWITHAHDDHLNALWALTSNFDCPLWSTAAVAEVVARPWAWFLPALPDGCARLQVRRDGETWQWEGFTLTALHFPGQCVYHAGLLVEKDGQKVLLCGDSFAPTGLDDYCADNRNLPGPNRGYRRCVALLRRYGAAQLVNEHQSEPFLYDEDYLSFLEAGMDRRDAALSALLPNDAGLGLDSQWMRLFPMEQTVTRGATLRLSVQLTGHGVHTVRIRPRLPWGGTAELAGKTAGLTSGTVTEEPKDAWLHADLPLPPDLTGRFSIPFDCWLDGQYLGSYLTGSVEIL